MSEKNPFSDPAFGANADGSQDNPFTDPDFGKPASLARKVGDVGLSVAKGVIAVPEAAVGLADLVTGGRAGKFLENEGGAVGFRPKQAKAVLSDMQSDDFKDKQRQFQQADGVVDKTITAVTNPSLIANAVAESVPSMLGGGVAARGLLAAAPRVGPVVAGAAGEGLVGAGSAAEQIRQETDDGLLTGDQAALAAGTGAATAGFGALGGRLQKALGIGDVDTMLAQGRIGAAADAAQASVAGAASKVPAKSIPRQVVEGAIAEGWLEELPQSVAEQVLQNMALNKPWHEGVDDAAVMGTLAGMAMGGTAAGVAAGFKPRADRTDTNPPTAEADPLAKFDTNGLSLAPEDDGTGPQRPSMEPFTGGMANLQRTFDPRNPGSTPPLALVPQAESGMAFDGAAGGAPDGSLTGRDPAELVGWEPFGPGPGSNGELLRGARGNPVRAAVQKAADAGGSLSAAAGLAMDSGAAPAVASPDADRMASTLAGSELARTSIEGLALPELQQVQERARQNGSWNVPLMAQRRRLEEAVKAAPAQAPAQPQAQPAPAGRITGTDMAGSLQGGNPLMDAARTTASASLTGTRAGDLLGQPDNAQFGQAARANERARQPRGVLAKLQQQREAANVQNAAPAQAGQAQAAPAQAAAPAAGGSQVSAAGVPAAGPGPLEAAGVGGIKAITAKLIPDMTDDELHQAIAHYGPDHKRTAKLQKEVQRRAGQTNGASNVVKTAEEGADAQGGAVRAEGGADIQDGAAQAAGQSDVPRSVAPGVPGSQAAVQDDEADAGAVGAADTKPAGRVTASHWDAATPAARRELLTAAGYTDADQARALSGASWSGLTDTVRRKLDKPVTQQGAEPVRSSQTADAPQAADKIGNIIVGRRADGVMIRQDKNGVRFYTEGGVRISETVEMRPTRQGVAISRGVLKPDFMTAEEAGAQQAEKAPDAAAQQDEPWGDGEEKSLMALLGHSGQVYVKDMGGFFDAVARSQRAGIDGQRSAGKTALKAKRTLLAKLQAFEASRKESAAPEAKPSAEKAKPQASANTIFTEDAAAAARALLKKKLGQVSSGIDPELLQAGITLAGYHIEKGARTFAAYAKAMVADLGDGVKPYLKSWYMGVKYDPRAASFDGMDSAAAVDAVNLDKLEGSSDTETSEDQNATRPLDQRSPPALEGTPAQDVQAPAGGGQATGGADAGGRGNGQGNADADGSGVQPARGLGSGARDLPVPARGARKQPRGARQSGVSADAAGPAGDQPARPSVDNGGIQPPAFTPTDFTIEEDFALGEGGQKTKFRHNVDALQLLKRLDAEGRNATRDEQEVLARYVGWGGISQAFDADNQDWKREFAELRELLTDEEYEAARRSTRYAHYTSRPIIQGMYAAMKRLGFTGGHILEPGAGVGNFMGLMPAELRSSSRLTGVERERIAAGIAHHLYPHQNMQLQDFTKFNALDGYFDAVIGNPPFASDPLTDQSGRKHLSGFSIHNYFFAKSVDLLREGGVFAAVVSNGFMDAKGDRARKYIGERTRLLGAIRLPNNAFAKNANTEVTTDIVFLQKLPESEWGGKAARQDMKRWLDTTTIPDPRGGEPVPVNQYFADNPQMMLGEYGRFGTMYGPDQPALVARPGQDMAALLAQAVERLPENVYVAPAVRGTEQADQNLYDELRDPTVQEGGFYTHEGKLYQRMNDRAGETFARLLTPESPWTEKTQLGESKYQRLVDLAGLRRTVRDLLAAELAGDSAMEGLRKALNEQYDAYAKAHGLLNDMSTAQVFDDDPDYPLLAALENNYVRGMGPAAAKAAGIKPFKSSADKAPIFQRRVIEQRKAVQKADSPEDALTISIAERGRIDVGYIGQLLGGSGEQAMESLTKGEKPLLFVDPVTGEYVLRDAYLSGNVRRKLEQAQAAGAEGNVRALLAVQPEDVGAHEIVARLGSPWVPTQAYEQFAQHLLGEGTRASVSYMALNSSFSLDIRPGSDAANTVTYGTKAMEATAILGALMNNRPVRVTYRDQEGKTHLDKEATDAANEKAQDIKAKFQDWLFADPDRAELLVRAYNDTNNNYVTRTYDGSYLKFPGKVPDAIIKFRRHQRNAIARIIQDRTALLDHVVGAGKTFTVISAAMELKRTGLAKKPLIVVPNHLVKQWAADFYRLYPGAKILTATKKDFERDNRRRFLAKIATGDWDAVIMAHSSFGFVKPDPDFETAFNQKQIEHILRAIKEVDAEDGDKQAKKRTVKQLEALAEKLENRIKSLREKPVDNLLDFAQIGVDQLFVDEAHLFKNLMFSTKMQNVQGLGDSKGSQRAYDMFVKVNELYAQNGRGQGVVFATGTPVSNTLAEMYHMMRYLMPQAIEEQGFQSFDAWANTFASVDQVWMQKPSGDGYKASDRMGSFNNTPELLKLFDQVSDTVTMEDIKKAYAEENPGKEFPLPKLKGDRRQPVSLRKSQAQVDFMESIAARAKALELKKGPPKKGDDNFLTIMGDARKAAMDIRLVMPEVTAREPGGRIDRASDEIVKRHQQFGAVKGTQLVFSDLGTPLSSAKKELKEYEALAERVAVLNDEALQADANLGDEAAIKKIQDGEAAQEAMDAKGRDWLDAVKAALRGFSVYDDLRQALVEKGIPEGEIAFIHDYNTDEQKAGLFRKVNAGQIRVLIGSTPKLGAGTNVQERLVALHHLDVPWKPSDIEQREGRIIRQGNRLSSEIPSFEVEILAYVTQDTLDMRMWQTQEVKLKMINQLRTRQISREIENPFEDAEMSAGEMQAAATGNMDLLREIQLRADVKKLEQRKRSFDAQKGDLASRKRRANEASKNLPAKIERLDKLATTAREYMDALDGREFKATINGAEFTSRVAAEDELRRLVDENDAANSVEGGLQKGDKIKLAVDFNGKVYGSKSALGEAMVNFAGDRDPIAWTFEREELRRRSNIAKAIQAAVVDAGATDTVRDIGSIGGFEVRVEGFKDKWGRPAFDVTVSANGETEDVQISPPEGGDGRNQAEAVIKAAERMVVGMPARADYARMDLRQAQKAVDDLAKVAMPEAWPDMAKLDKARGEHRTILDRLAGKADAAQGGDGEPAQFSRAPGAGLSRQASDARLVAIQQHIDAITDNWANAPEVIVARNMQDALVPKEVRDYDAMLKSQGATGAPRGFYHRGKAYLLSDNIASRRFAETVLFHEVLGHYGLRGTFGPALKPILQQLATMRRGDVAAKAKEYGLNMAIEDERLQAAEEVLAEMAQKQPEHGFVKRAIAAIRQWLRQHVPGFSKMAMTNDDIIASYILPARGFVERGRKASQRGAMPAFQREEADQAAPAGEVDTDVRFSRADGVADRLGQTIKAVTATNLKEKAGYKMTDLLGLGLQGLGRRQLVDVYGGLLPLDDYNRLVAQMEADKNEGGAEADKLVTRWSTLPDEFKLAELMHDATLAQIDPDKPYVAGDDKAKYQMLRGRFGALTDEAKTLYRDARDSYRAHHEKVRQAIKDRILRSEIRGERKAALLAQMDSEFFKAVKGVYFPLARFGQYVVAVKGPDGKVESVGRAETMAEAQELRKNLLAGFPAGKGYTVGRVMLSKEFIADRDAVGRGFMTELYHALDKQDLDVGQRAELEDTLGQLYLSSMPDLSWAKHGIHRKGTPGFSQDARRAFAQNMFHGARYLAKLRYSDLMTDELARMQKHVDDWREVSEFDQPKAQRVVDEFNKRHETLMNPKSNPLSTALTSFGFIFHLGLSPASALVNLSQTALVAYPVMGAKWGFDKAGAALLAASKQAAQGKNDIRGALSDEEKSAYDEAVRSGVIDVTMAHDLAGIAQGEDAGVMWRIRPVMKWASFLFHHAERFNRQVTFVAAYRLAREAGADKKAAFDQAAKATYDGHFDYGAANRPRVMQGNAAKVLLLFKQYGQNMVYTLSRQAFLAVKAGTPEQRAEARRALGGLLVSHAMAAGVLGLPLVTTLLAAASMLGGDDDEPWDAKVALQNMLADTFGQKPAEVMSHGLSRLTPWDISSRVGLDKLILPDIQEGLEGQRLAESAMAAALGPVAGIAVNALKGLQDMGDGHYARGLEAMMPAALRGPVKAIRYANEGAQDKTGVSIVDEVNPAGVLGQALGFSPSQVRNATDGKSAVLSADRALNERRQELLGQFARAAMAQEQDGMAEARHEIASFNEKHPGRRIQANHLMASVRNRQRRVHQAQDGVYLPRNHRDVMDVGRFATAD